MLAGYFQIRYPHFCYARTSGRSLGIALFLLMLGLTVGVQAQQPPSPEKIREALETELPEDPATLISVVGQSPILLGDLMPKIETRLKAIEQQQGRALSPEEAKYGKVNMLRGMLQQTIQAKMMGEAFLLKQVGTQDAEKRDEVQQMMQTRARKLFFDNQIPHMMKKLDLTKLTELDQKLKEEGSSLKAQQREFIDSMLGRMYLQEMVDQDPTVTILEIHQYYDQHREEFQQQAKARWEQLTVRFDRFPTREAAAEALAKMGNEALFGGNMQAVAREQSQEPFASTGGLHDWTSRGSLASEKLESQIFSLPLNKMSPFIEDEDGFHIIKVLERTEAGIQPVSELQDKIREKIRKRKILDSEEALLAEMRTKVPVWTLFPEDVEGAMPLGQKTAKRVQTVQR